MLAVFMVSNLNDAGDGSLRAAIHDANVAPGYDEIEFDDALTGTINLNSGQLTITDALTIDGPGPDRLTIDANEHSRVFNINDGVITPSLNVQIGGVTITGGRASSDGGGISSHENLLVINSTISGNTADDGGGGIHAFGQVTVIDSTISGNTSHEYGGGIYAFGNVTVTSSTISGNTSVGAKGGGIYAGSEVSVTNSTISNNIAGDGGGIYAWGGVTVAVSTISGNTARNSGGGINANGGDVAVTSSTISGNTAGGQGGGIRAYSENVDRAVTVTNSTISDNTARAGGGVFVICDDECGKFPVTVRGSILSGNTVEDQVPQDAEGSFTSFDANHSLIGLAASARVTAGSDNIVDDNPQLGPLADNGGPTKTHALLPGSAAIDAGDPDSAPPPEFDQRGASFARVIDGDGDGTARIDIGSFEFSASNPADLTGNGFVDFEDLTVLLAAWNQNVSAAEGNLIDADGTPVNFEDLTVLLAAWTGPGAAGVPVGRRLAAARETSASERLSFESDSELDAPRQAATYDVVMLKHNLRAERRGALRARSASGIYGLGRLQAAAVDRAMDEVTKTPQSRAAAIVRRRR